MPLRESLLSQMKSSKSGKKNRTVEHFVCSLKWWPNGKSKFPLAARTQRELQNASGKELQRNEKFQIRDPETAH